MYGPPSDILLWLFVYHSEIQGVSKVRSDFFLAYISLIIKNTFGKTKYVIHYSVKIE